MKKVKYLLPLLLLFITINVKAIDKCTTEEMNRLKELANKVQIKTEYKILDGKVDDGIDGQSVVYKVQLIDFSNDLSLYKKSNSDSEFELVNPNKINELYFYEGDTVTFNIYSYTTNLCTDELLKTINIKMDYYNFWYYNNKEKCNNRPDFKYCKEFMKVDKEDKEIDKMFLEYDEEINGDKNSNILNFVSNFRYLIIIISSIIVIGAILFVTLRKNNKKEKI